MELSLFDLQISVYENGCQYFSLYIMLLLVMDSKLPILQRSSVEQDFYYFLSLIQVIHNFCQLCYRVYLSDLASCWLLFSCVQSVWQLSLIA